MQEKRETGFIRGLLCGVLLTLICLTACIAAMRYKLLQQYQSPTASVQETQEAETESSLTLDTDQIADKIREIEDYINGYYLGGIDSGEVEEYVYTGMVAGLGDAYSAYYSAEELALLNESTDGAYTGIGLQIGIDPETDEILVTECYEDTPAMEAGTQAGDILRKINGEDVDDWTVSEAVAKIRNSGSDTVTLTLERDGEELEAEVALREVEVTTVTAEMLEDQVGYLRITEFDTVTTEQFREKLEKLKEQGMEKLVVDVRDNPGGVLQVVCDILDEILPEGLLVSVEYKDGEKDEYYSDDGSSLDLPLAVLINGNSASASEIFAGAVKDFGAGTLVGENTYGKGVVQRTFTLSDGSGVKLTIAKYYTPNGTDIHQKGIAPDVEAELADGLALDEISHEEDTQLQAALEVLGGS